MSVSNNVNRYPSPRSMGDSMVVPRRPATTSTLTDDCAYEDVPTGAVNTGKDGLRKYAEFWLSVAPDFKVDLSKQFETDDWATGEWTMSGTQTSDMPNLPATGKFFSIRGATVPFTLPIPITEMAQTIPASTKLIELEQGKIR